MQNKPTTKKSVIENRIHVVCKGVTPNGVKCERVCKGNDIYCGKHTMFDTFTPEQKEIIDIESQIYVLNKEENIVTCAIKLEEIKTKIAELKERKDSLMIKSALCVRVCGSCKRWTVTEPCNVCQENRKTDGAKSKTQKSKCKWFDKKRNNCKDYALEGSEYCNDHKYVEKYTTEQKNINNPNVRNCSGCGNLRYFDPKYKHKTCEKCVIKKKNDNDLIKKNKALALKCETTVENTGNQHKPVAKDGDGVIEPTDDENVNIQHLSTTKIRELVKKNRQKHKLEIQKNIVETPNETQKMEEIRDNIKREKITISNDQKHELETQKNIVETPNKTQNLKVIRDYDNIKIAITSSKNQEIEMQKAHNERTLSNLLKKGYENLRKMEKYDMNTLETKTKIKDIEGVIKLQKNDAEQFVKIPNKIQKTLLICNDNDDIDNNDNDIDDNNDIDNDNDNDDDNDNDSDNDNDNDSDNYNDNSAYQNIIKNDDSSYQNNIMIEGSMCQNDEVVSELDNADKSQNFKLLAKRQKNAEYQRRYKQKAQLTDQKLYNKKRAEQKKIKGTHKN